MRAARGAQRRGRRRIAIRRLRARVVGWRGGWGCRVDGGPGVGVLRACGGDWRSRGRLRVAVAVAVG